MNRKIPADPWAMTPGYSLCPDCGEPLQDGVCAQCGRTVEIPPVSTRWLAVYLGVLVLLTGLFTWMLQKGVSGVFLAFAWACGVMLAGCVLWFWASFRYGLDKRVLLRATLATMGLFVVDMVGAALLSAFGS